jgi:electron transport complex protein RnfA
MADLLLLALSASLVNHFVFSSVIGVRPVVAASRRVEAAAGMGVAALFVLTIASTVSHLVWRGLLEPFDLGYLRPLVLILFVTAAAQVGALLLRAQRPLLHEVLRGFVPLLATHGAVLGLAIIYVARPDSLIESLACSLSTAAGFALMLVLFALLQERVDTSDLPRAFRGAPIALVTAGLMALAFIGLNGIGAR